MDEIAFTQHLRLILLGAIAVVVVRELILFVRHRDNSFYAVVPLFGATAFVFVLGRFVTHLDPSLGVREFGVRMVLVVGFLSMGPVGLACGRLAGGLRGQRRRGDHDHRVRARKTRWGGADPP